MMKTLSAFLSRALVLFYSLTELSKQHKLEILSLKQKIKINYIIMPLMELGCNHIIMQIIGCIYQMKTKRMQVLHCLQNNPAAYYASVFS